MKDTQNTSGRHMFFYGLALLTFSAGTVALVTDPFVMADIALIALALFLIVSGILNWSRQ